MELPDTQLRYLYAIYELSKKAPEVRSSTVADRMRVTRPSVARMLAILAERELIVKKRYGKISLTEKGLRLVRDFDRNVGFLEGRLPRLGFPLTEKEAHEVAYLLAAALPERVWRARAGTDGDEGNRFASRERSGGTDGK